jgi:hypothetical protein
VCVANVGACAAQVKLNNIWLSLFEEKIFETINKVQFQDALKHVQDAIIQ